MMRTMIVAAIAGIVFTSGASAAAPELLPERDMPVWIIRPCTYEDSVNCHWDAGTRGNGRGHSFVVRRVPGSAGMVCVFYVESAYARTHDYCAGNR